MEIVEDDISTSRTSQSSAEVKPNIFIIGNNIFFSKTIAFEKTIIF